MNLFILKLDKKQFKKFIILLILLFSVEPTMADFLEGMKGKSIYGISTIGALGSQWGYTIITFVLIYFIAAYTKQYGIPWNKSLNAIMYMLSIVLLVIWKVIELRIGNSIAAEHYQNPLVIFESVSIFMIFKGMKIHKKLINFFSKGCFTVFLLHAYFIHNYMVTDIVNRNTVVFLTGLLIRTMMIFFICDFIGMLYSLYEKIVFDYIEKNLKFYSVKI